MQINKCTGLAGLILGHKYQTVIIKDAPTLRLEKVEGNAGSTNVLRDIIDASKPERLREIYCVRCGHTLTKGGGRDA